MLQLSLFELLFRLMPEGFLMCSFMYSFSDKQILDKKKFIITGLIFGITPYLVRLMPINFGIHTIISIIVYMVVAVNINDIYIIKAISSALIGTLILFVCDFINLLVVVHVFKISVENLLENIFIKTLLGLPSLLLFLIFVVWFHRRSFKKTSINIKVN